MPIQTLQASDDTAMAAIIRQCLQAAGLDRPGTAFFDPELNHLSRFYAQSSRRAYFVYHDERHILGGCGFAEYEPDRQIAELQKLYLLPQARGQHLGRRLLNYVEAQAKAAGWQQLYLETHTALPVAIHLYETNGYHRLDQPLHQAVHTTMDHFYLKSL